MNTRSSKRSLISQSAFGRVKRQRLMAVESSVVEVSSRIDPHLLKKVGTVLERCYNEVIRRPELLRQYKSGSPHVYGEAMLELVIKLIDECQLAGTTFVDLGSGVGQVCMMVAALSKASSCFGIEIMDHPAQYAVQLLSRFKSSAKVSSIAHAPIELQHGDFLKSSEVRDAVSRAGLIFMNNPKFGPELNLKVLVELCPLMPKGCKLICFDSLIGTRARTRPDSSDVLVYKKLIKVGDGAVSWKYYGVDLHVLERV